MATKKHRPAGDRAAAGATTKRRNASVPLAYDEARRGRADGLTLLRYPAAYATAYGPAGRRRRYAAMVRCPYCAGGHLIYGGAFEDLRGVKAAGCRLGRYWVVISRSVLAAEAVAG